MYSDRSCRYDFMDLESRDHNEFDNFLADFEKSISHGFLKRNRYEFGELFPWYSFLMRHGLAWTRKYSNLVKPSIVPVKIFGVNVPPPCKSLEELNLPEFIYRKEDYLKLSICQKVILPTLLSKRDLIGICNTGSGKTMSYLLPMIICISEILENPEYGKNSDFESEVSPEGLIICPTREMVMGITSYAKQFLRNSNIKVSSVYGGARVRNQILQVRNSNIVVCTPGRLEDFIFTRKILNTDRVKFLVLEEVDRVLNMGFTRQVSRILDMAVLSDPQISFFTSDLRGQGDINFCRAYMTDERRKKGGYVLVVIGESFSLGNRKEVIEVEIRGEKERIHFCCSNDEKECLKIFLEHGRRNKNNMFMISKMFLLL